MEDAAKQRDDVTKQRDEALEENRSFRHVMEEMRRKVECPVCLVMPREAPAMCPRGHFMCHCCKERRSQNNQNDCPTCDIAMGDIKSLLAMVVIENTKHECVWVGCSEVVPRSEYQEQCAHRLVACPGSWHHK